LGALRKRAEELTGEKKIYLCNITDEVDRLVELHDIAVKNGANAVMVNGMAAGFSAVRMLRKHARVPIVSHFDFMAPFIQLPWFGVKDQVFTKLAYGGFDVLIYRFRQPPEDHQGRLLPTRAPSCNRCQPQTDAAVPRAANGRFVAAAYESGERSISASSPAGGGGGIRRARGRRRQSRQCGSRTKA
jgi:hypothetical protein